MYSAQLVTHSTNCRHRYHRRLSQVFTLSCAMLTNTFGCNLSERISSVETQPTRLAIAKQLQATYPEVQFHGAHIVADFQSPRQARLFRVLGPNDQPGRRPQPTISLLPEYPESAGRGLVTALNSSNDRLVFNVADWRNSAPEIDWTDFGVLLLSVYGPPGGADLNLSLQCRTATPSNWLQALNIDPGWNHVRIDLDKIGRRLNLADVRAIMWQLVPKAEPVSLYFDDLILANRTEWLTGQDAGSGELYALSRGQRLFVGTPNRFELIFSDGIIVEWRADAPVSLVGPQGLGPWPVTLEEGWFRQPEVAARRVGLKSMTGLKQVGQTEQTVVEATTFRLVMESRRRLECESSATQPFAEKDQHEHIWRYVIYPDGRIYVQISSHAGSDAWTRPRLGYAVALEGRAGFRLLAPPAAGPRHTPAKFALLARTDSTEADLLWSVYQPTVFAQQRAVPLEDQQALIAIAGDIPAAGTVQTTHLLHIRPPDNDNVSQAERMAGDYQHPVRLQPLAGHAVTISPGDFDHDGYNESEGCYELALRRGRLLFDFIPGRYPRHNPIFRIHGTADKRCWIYCHGEALASDHRDVEGRLLFMLPGTIRAPRTIEVYATPRQLTRHNYSSELVPSD